MIISSTKNELIKQYKKLAEQKDIICLDNPKLIQEALLTNNKPIVVLKNESSSFNLDCNCEIVLVTDNVLSVFSNTITSQGIVALIQIKEKALAPPSGNFLVLDRVQDPGNVGTLIRSAVGANFKDIYLINCASAYNDKTVRSTMGAIFKANIYQTDFAILDALPSWNLPVYVADMNGKNIYSHKFETKCGIIIGNEGKGVCEELKKIATNTIKIPMENNLESLNAGVSGSIIMYQIQNGGK